MLNALVVRVVHRHPSGFADPDERLIPYNAVCQLRRIRPDVIIAAELGAATLQAIGYARLRPSARVVIVVGLSERTEASRGVLRRLLRRFLLRRADAIITIGSGSVRYLERFGVGRKAIFVMPRTTDMRPFLDLPLSRDEEAARAQAVKSTLERAKVLIDTKLPRATIRWLHNRHWQTGTS